MCFEEALSMFTAPPKSSQSSSLCLALSKYSKLILIHVIAVCIESIPVESDLCQVPLRSVYTVVNQNQ